MRIVICDNAEAATDFVIAQIVATLRANPASVLGLATGGTMEPVYDGLIAAYGAGLSFARTRCFNLDEYVGLAPDHPQSYHSYMRAKFFDHVDVPADQCFLPRGDREPSHAAAEYEARLVEHGPIDLQLLGLGHNGHIGFNEPSSSLASRTREKTLTRRTRDANARFFGPGETPPQSAVTIGIGTILESRRALVLAVGGAKADAVAQVVEGPVSAVCPGSALQFHRDVTLALDPAAAANLRLTEHYLEAENLRRSRTAG